MTDEQIVEKAEPEGLIRCAECGSLLGTQVEAEAACPLCGSLEREWLPVGEREDAADGSGRGPKRVPGPNDEALDAPEEEPGPTQMLPDLGLSLHMRRPLVWKQTYPDGSVTLCVASGQPTQMGLMPLMPAVMITFYPGGWETFREFVDKTDEQILQEAADAQKEAERQMEASAARARILGGAPGDGRNPSPPRPGGRRDGGFA